MTQTGTGVAAVLFLVMITAHCGGSSRHDLVSITVTPPSATAMSPNGTVQFVAIGNFSSAPATQKIAVSWTGNPRFRPSIATVWRHVSCRVILPVLLWGYGPALRVMLRGTRSLGQSRVPPR
jgi:hypothetical protein